MGGKNPKSKTGESHFSSHSVNTSVCMCVVEVEGEILPLNSKSGVVLCHYSRRDFIFNCFPNLADLYFPDTAAQCFVYMLFIDMLSFSMIIILFPIYEHIFWANMMLVGKVIP